MSLAWSSQSLQWRPKVLAIGTDLDLNNATTGDPANPSQPTG
jgi:hypothetical protein